MGINNQRKMQRTLACNMSVMFRIVLKTRGKKQELVKNIEKKEFLIKYFVIIYHQLC